MSGHNTVFDLASLTAICARWPETPVPKQPLLDSLLERIRQILLLLSQSPATAPLADLIPLIRQILLRDAPDNGHWLRVPASKEWPSAETWKDAQFQVLDDGATLRIQPNWPRLSFLRTQADLYDDAFKYIPSRPPASVPADPLMGIALDLPTYTGEGQREAVRALLHLPPGDTLIANLPTGSGKSLLGQVPPLIEAEHFLTLAIVPTVALAIDQGLRMRTLLQRRYPYRELPPLAFHGGLTPEDHGAVRRAIRDGLQPILFTSPEHAVGSLRGALEEAAGQGRLNRVVIDEAHLVIGWGNGFRPAFQLLPALVSMLRSLTPNRQVRVVLASATLTSSTIRDLRHLFGPPERVYVMSAVHLRPEIRYAFLHCDERERKARMLEAVRFAPRPFILYVTRPDEADAWLRTLREAGLRRVDKFTGATSSTDRERLLKQWRSNDLDGMVATSAFGLGVDKSDVRTVLHATLPDSLDRYYQEVGRAGRDGRAGAALLLHTEQDRNQALGLASPKLISDDKGFERWSVLIDHAKKHDSWPDVSWVELARLPAHLNVQSDASRDWNVRTLTLMARAQLIELVELAVHQRPDTEVPQSLSDVTHAAIRILDDGHHNPGVFNERMASARSDVYDAAQRGFKAMVAVAEGKEEVSAALRKMYSVSEGAWVPVTVCCGGCPTHWAQRSECVQYRPPVAPRLTRFAPRSVRALQDLSLSHARIGLLVIDVQPDAEYVKNCAELLRLLAMAVRFHTVALEKSFARRHRTAIERVLIRDHGVDTFIDIIDANVPGEWEAGVGEVRVLLWGYEQPPALPEEVYCSNAHLEILVVPSDFPDRHHTGRRFIDTTPHVHAADLLHLLMT